MENNKGKFNYFCKYCIKRHHFHCRKKSKIIEHIKKCKDEISKLEEYKDYVKCKICNFHGQSLGKHIIKFHNLSVSFYNKKYGVCISEKSKQKFSLVNKENGCWIAREKAKGTDLSDYYKRNGLAVSKAIMANPESRKKRSENMKKIITNLLLDPKYIKFLSDNAKITSARIDIQAQRAEKLKKWREKNPEKVNLIIENMLKTFQSKPEKMLFGFVSKIENFNFRKNQFIKDEIFSNKTNKKQLDMSDKSKKIIIEYDGEMHFKNFFGEEILCMRQKRDKELNDYVLNNNYLLIRVSYDQFIDKQNIKNCKFKFGALKQLVKILKQNKPGVYKIGEAYGEY